MPNLVKISEKIANAIVQDRQTNGVSGVGENVFLGPTFKFVGNCLIVSFNSGTNLDLFDCSLLSCTFWVQVVFALHVLLLFSWLTEQSYFNSNYFNI